MATESNTVEIQVTFRNSDSVPQIREYVLRRLGRVIQSLPNLKSASVEIGFEQTGPADQRYVVQATLAANGNLIRGEDHGPNATSAIDRVHDLLARRIRDRRGRAYLKRRQTGARSKDAVEMEATRSLPDEKSDLVVRVKSHATKPLFIEDAIEQMELLGHDFFFFLNAETGRHNVVYGRKAGGYGLIQPSTERFEAGSSTEDPASG